MHDTQHRSLCVLDRVARAIAIVALIALASCRNGRLLLDAAVDAGDAAIDDAGRLSMDGAVTDEDASAESPRAETGAAGEPPTTPGPGPSSGAAAPSGAAGTTAAAGSSGASSNANAASSGGSGAPAAPQAGAGGWFIPAIGGVGGFAGVSVAGLDAATAAAIEAATAAGAALQAEQNKPCVTDADCASTLWSPRCDPITARCSQCLTGIEEVALALRISLCLTRPEAIQCNSNVSCLVKYCASTCDGR